MSPSRKSKAKPVKAAKGDMAAPRSAEKPQPAADPGVGFPIVGIGASAGGLAAFEAFFSSIPPDIDPGMAFVLVQHLAPDHKSILVDLIRRYTRMQVFEVEDGMVVRPNCTYIIPPNRDMAFLNGSLQLLEPSAPRGHRLPIDYFFRSLAQDQRERAICVVLSGTGSDGTLGVRAIKGEGGMVMVQNPASAEHDGMPRSALATGMVDYVLPPAEMPAQIMVYVAHAFGNPPRPASDPPSKIENALKKIFILLRDQTNHDFSQYKSSTILRRIERRMAVQQIETIDDYVKFLQQASTEVEALFRDLLIGVTSFFRDPKAFQVLEEEVVPRLFADKFAGALIRVWSVGCSTGEEAYSLAILLAEHQKVLKKSFNVQVFATDIDSRAIATARAGLYPASIASDISPERLASFFTTEPDGSAMRIHKSIRDMLIFSEQNVIKDPPISKLDLISCRNLLIYLGRDLQKKLIPLFHYALNPNGFLFLGTSETVGDYGDLFAALFHKAKLYQRKDDSHRVHRMAPVSLLSLMTRPHPPFAIGEFPLPVVKTAGPKTYSLRELTEQALLRQMSPAAVLVDRHGNILYLHGRTGMYLEPAPGEAGVNNILKMARDGLRAALTTALHSAASDNVIVHRTGLRVRTNGDLILVNLTILPMPTGLTSLAQGGPTNTPVVLMYLVILEQGPSLKNEQAPQARLSLARRQKAEQRLDTDAETRIAALEQELRTKEEYVQAAAEELETSNEELRASNEEMQSINEELQSTNEELETSKEELQSVNEELATVNTELQTKVADLTRTNNDMSNLLAGTGIGTVFVDQGLRIQRFTPAATKIINLILSDVGRPVGHIVSNLKNYADLTEDIESVLDTLVPKQMEVQSQMGAWYTMRIQPYRTLNNVIEGAVITFVDITAMKKTREALQKNEERFRLLVQNSSDPIFSVNRDGTYRFVNDAFAKPLHAAPEQIIGKTPHDFFPPDKAAEQLALVRKVLDTGEKADVRGKVVTSSGEEKAYILQAEPVHDDQGTPFWALCVSRVLAAETSSEPPTINNEKAGNKSQEQNP
jgi:two-component system, chemotaxis family, CheB/CheR fusion protein